MSTVRLSVPAAVTPARVASAFAVLVGLTLASYGASVQYDASQAIAAGTCDGCTPWHPLFVVTPLAVGIGLVAIGSYTLAKTTC